MTDATVERRPAFAAVWREQLRFAGLAIRRETVLAATLLGLFCVFAVVVARVPALATLTDLDGEFVNFRLDPAEPGFGLWGIFTALLLPLLVWKGERPFGDTPIWSLPVDHRRHALTKVAAGWVWLMVILAGALVCVVLATLAGGGALGADEVRQLIIDPGFLDGAGGDLGVDAVRQFIADPAGFFDGASSATRNVAWTTPWWEWVLPFTSATAAYLLASALLLATAYPFRWAVALCVFALVLVGVMDFYEADSLQPGLEYFGWIIGAEDFIRFGRLSTGEFVRGWRLLPSVGMWVGWATFWISLGVAGVLAASARVRDH